MATTVDYILKIGSAGAKKSLQDVGKETQKLDSTFKGTAKRIGKSVLAIGASFAAVGGAVFAFGQKMADLANNLSDTSAKTGLATSTLAGLKLAAEGSGLSFGSLQSGLIRFQSSMLDAANGTGMAKEAFQALGIDARNSSGELRDADSVFKELTSKMSEMENQTLRNAFAIDIFGQRAGPALIQSGAINNMQAFSEFASTFGVNMKEAGDEAANFQRAMAEIKMVLEGVFSGLLTTATGTTKLSDGLFKISDNIVFFGTIAKGVLGNVRGIVTGLIEGFKGLKSVIRNTGHILVAVFSGDFAKAEQIANGTSEFVEQQLEKMTDAFTTNMKDTERLGREAEAAVRKQQELRAGLMSSITGAPATGGSGSAGVSTPAAAAVEKQFTNAILSDLNVGIGPEFSAAMKSLETLPEDIKGTLSIGMASLGAEIAVGIAQGPEQFVNILSGMFDGFLGGISGTIGKVVTGIARLGEKSPEEIQKEFETFVKAFSKGLMMLPRILIQVLPKFAFQLGIEIIKGILKLPALLAEALFESLSQLVEPLKQFFREIFTKEGRQEKRARAKRQGELTNFQKFLVLAGGGSTSEFMSGGIMQAQSGMKFTGAKRGLAMLHEGEAVIPASGRAGQAEQRFMNGSSGGGINIVINSAVVENRAIDSLVRKLENRFGNFGVGKSTLFGR